MASTLRYASKTDLENLLLINIDSSFNSQIDTWISTAEDEVNNFLGFTTASGLWNEYVSPKLEDICRIPMYVVFEDHDRATGPKVHRTSCGHYQRWLRKKV